MGIFDITGSSTQVEYQEKVYKEIQNSPNRSSKTLNDFNNISMLSANGYLSPSPVNSSSNSLEYPKFDGNSYFVNCQLGEGYGVVYLPVIPDEINDQISSSWSDTSIVGRSSPVSAYIGTGFRSISFSFDLHADMVIYKSDTEVYNINKGTSTEGRRLFERIISRLRATVYPMYSSSSRENKTMKPPITFFRFGQFAVKGIVRNVSFAWKKPLDDQDRYKLCTVSISIDGIPSHIMGANDIAIASAASPFGNTYQ